MAYEPEERTAHDGGGFASAADLKRLQRELIALDKRVVVLETRQQDTTMSSKVQQPTRSEVMAAFGAKAQPPPQPSSSGQNGALEAVKILGPVLVALVSLAVTLVQMLANR